MHDELIGAVIKSISTKYGEDIDNRFGKEYCSFQLTIETDKGTIIYEGCHDFTPDIEIKKIERYKPDRKALGGLLKAIRIQNGLTLRQFCLGNDIDPFIHSEIERNIRKTTEQELNIILEQLNVEKDSADWREAHRLLMLGVV